MKRILKNIYKVIKGECYKFKASSVRVDDLPRLLPLCKPSPRLIVSLTSYGRRTEKVVFYTLLSLLRQTLLPDKIILWLDNDHWNENNLPNRLKQLKVNGIEFKFCEDFRSYKKLIPSLKEFPNDIIITVDDDVIYPPYLIERLYDSYLKNPAAIHACACREISVIDGKLQPYDSWKSASIGSDKICPIGYGGVLYPPHSLSEETIKESLFMRMCPNADDIWFYIMAKIKGTRHFLVSVSSVDFFGVDNIYQFFHRNGALSNINVKEGLNDIQLANCLEYYKLDLKE